MGGSILRDEDELLAQRLIAARLERGGYAGYKVTRARSLGVVSRLHGAGPSCASTTLPPPGARTADPPDDRLTNVASVFEAVRDAHALVILTDWEEPVKPGQNSQVPV